eukprot:CAMPEP_0176068270 /NCGR_PEP_ID=MMETSP0120_2-20121206/34078_1 /TAXON_ID=160619 /ORGANISM="Kryptoperidinium foliaceum, Strain CCMP 1326" /LENGTH=55 /DNA_ID=CAMNT_0017401889 /DNA_START=102 /DNA_END=269 /DNA_ORIENTATION=-
MAPCTDAKAASVASTTIRRERASGDPRLIRGLGGSRSGRYTETARTIASSSLSSG